MNRTTVPTRPGSPPTFAPAGALAVVFLLATLPAASGQTVELRQALRPGSAGDRFGCALQVSGDLLAVGSFLDDEAGSDAGALYIFQLDGDVWSVSAKLLPVPAARGRFGYSVGLSGSCAIAGAPLAGSAGQGAAVVACRNAGGGWTQLPLTPATASVQDQFGWSVAISGDLAAVGVPGDDQRGSAAGAVYLFERGNGDWSLRTKLTAVDGGTGDAFGYSVALGGGRLAVGAPFADATGADSGALYLFERTGGGWAQLQKLTAGAAGDALGFAVALGGDRLLAGAPRADATGPDAGRVYGATLAGGQFTALTPEALSAGAGDQLGNSLALAGGRTLAGARRDDDRGPNAGASYLAGLPGGTVKLLDPAGAAGDELGLGASVDSRFAVVGSYLDDDAGTNSGSAFVFEIVPATPPPPPPPPPPPTPPGTTADLAITKSGPATVTAGSPVTYTLTVTNAGPGAATGATVLDTFPSSLSTVTWSCVPFSGASCPAAGTGNLALAVTLPAGSGLTLTATGVTSASFSGTLTNSASVVPPTGVTDPSGANNASSAATTVSPPPPVADLSVAIVAPSGPLPAGTPYTYVITVANAGPSTATGAAVVDAFPAGFAPVLSCPAPSGGASSTVCPASSLASEVLADTVGLPAGASLTYTVAVTIPPDFGGLAVNTATVDPPATVVDPDLSNNTAIAVTATELVADLRATKTDGVAAVQPGDLVTYTVTATNDGPSDARGTTLVDPQPPGLVSFEWSCLLPGSVPGPGGAGDLFLVVDLPVGSAAVCTVSALVDPINLTEIENLASVAPGVAVIDPDTSNNTAVDVDAVVTGVTGTKVITALEQPVVVYQITLTNAGPFPQLDNPGPEFFDLLPPELALIQAVASSGVVMLAPSTVTWNGEIPVGATVTIDITADFVQAPDPSLICNRATLFIDSDGNGVNDLQLPTDDPNRPGTGDETCFALPLEGVNIPTLGPAGLALLALLLAGVGMLLLRRGREVTGR